MFRYRSYKQALIMTAMVIFLCLVCLSGATLALFTSNPSDGTIGIVTTTGSVKVNIVDAVSGESLVGESLRFNEEDVWFEPGVTFYTQGFQIRNDGAIPINFRLSISKDDGINMDAFNKAFDVWISTDPTNLGNGVPLADFTGNLAVGAGSVDTYYLFVKMKENAGNEFQAGYYKGIGVTVYAVQGNVQI